MRQGNKITKIALYTGLMKQKTTNDSEMHTYLEKVEGHVKELSGGMRDFIWVLDPSQDTVNATLMRIPAIWGIPLCAYTCGIYLSGPTPGGKWLGIFVESKTAPPFDL